MKLWGFNWGSLPIAPVLLVAVELHQILDPLEQDGLDMPTAPANYCRLVQSLFQKTARVVPFWCLF